MLKNYYITAIRNLQKHQSYFILNISGLAIGIASFIFISLYIYNELSYDTFHSNAQNTYRVHVAGQAMGQSMDMAVSASPMSKALVNDYPEVDKVTRVKESGAWYIGYGDKKFNEDGVLFADSSFFDVFDFNLLAGDPKTALVHPRSMILTESYAKKYFGNENPMGKKITVEQDTIFYTVTGVLADIPDHSHIHFDMLGSISTYKFWDNNQWVSHNFYTYLTLNPNADRTHFESKMQTMVTKYMGPQIEQFLGITMDEFGASGNSFRYYLMPLEDIHLYSDSDSELEANSDISYIYIYSLIAIILLFIAVINFVNLATAQSSSRAKEVGVRKVSGSSRQGLIFQFIFESIILSLLSTAVAYILIVFLMPYFTALIGKELSIDMTTNYIAWLIMLGLAVVIGILAGFYPAFVLAAFKPAQVLKGSYRSGVKSGWLRNLLVIVQFTASIVIIIGTVVVYSQTNYMMTKNLGFDKEQVVVIRRPDVLRANLELFKTRILQNPNVSAVANSVSIPGKDRYNNNAFIKEEEPELPYILYQNNVSYGYGELMGLKLTQGRFFSRDYPSDSSAVVINEATVKSLGYDEPLGKRFINKNRDGSIDYLTIIGVVEDYHIESLHRQIPPTILTLMPGNLEGYAIVKINTTNNVNETISYIESTWYDHSYGKPFQYFFFEEDYQKLYKSESTTGQVFLVFAVLSIFIACLGLIGLITYTLAIRKKEIGIRKVLGASTQSLVQLLSTEIIKLIAVSTLIAWPLAYFATDYWLQNFASRLSVSPWTYILATLVVFLIGSIAISFQTIRASLKNPVEALRQD
ncbi:putative ABC transport system permease protein [Reichenbachiella agariperforans]|uniref:Putative ABC transport system permease protein n=1 Tax=Reichenbachiella agariperforans TaxID=156994 RepID=A0A1M6VNV7_REIAG|nr:ABC transporter permease [Reichenbachiella agariperforans]SHK83015.1 putative ABC transport system permease protein [Reichenbachiella agariperforans]